MPGTLVRRPRVLQIATSVVPSVPSSHRPRVVAGVAAVLLLLGVITVAAPDMANAAPSASLTRYPYLTDSIQNSITVNWATTATGTTGRVQWGPVGNCAATTTTATKTNTTVNSVAQFQWKASLPVRLRVSCKETE